MDKSIDNTVAKFTRELLGLAREKDIDFEYAGHRPTKWEEIMRVMKINNKVLDRMRKKQ